MTFSKLTLLASITLLAIGIAGCGKTSPEPSGDKSAPKTAESHSDKGHDHSGWWCAEHGIPEEVCGQCNAKLAAEFQKKGDWCKDHDRPDSQCFICHPELEAKFAAQYEAKFGKKAPPREG